MMSLTILNSHNLSIQSRPGLRLTYPSLEFAIPSRVIPELPVEIEQAAAIRCQRADLLVGMGGGGGAGGGIRCSSSSSSSTRRLHLG